MAAVRLGKWEEVARRIDQQEGGQRSRPATRYVRARAALALGDYETALQLLQGLEQQLAPLATQIARTRAEVQLHTGAAEEAARFFSAQKGANAQIQAARGWKSSGRIQDARIAIDRAVRSLGQRQDAIAVEAHALRAEIAQATKDNAQAARDMRFVALHAPERQDVRDIGEAIARLDPAQALTAADYLDRARALAQTGEVQSALEELDHAAHVPKKPVAPAALAFAKAMFLYLGRDHYVEAAEVFEDTAKLDPQRSAEALFYAGKAWMRADRNQQASAKFRDVQQRFPTTRWAESAAYQAARLAMLEAKCDEAVRLYADYLARYVRGENVRAARYEQAVCMLAAGQAKEANHALARVTARGHDRLATASLKQIQGLAALRTGDVRTATEMWRQVAVDDPLTWPALMARSRLFSLGQSLPPAIAPASAATGDPLEIDLPQEARIQHDLGLDQDAEDFLGEHEHALARPYGARGGEALCRLYGKLDGARRQFQLGQRVVAARLLSVAASTSTRWAWECVLPRPYDEAVATLERRESIARGLLHAMMRQESGFDPDARSRTGAIGVMQLLPSTARRVAEEMGDSCRADRLHVPTNNLELGAHYLAKLLTMFRGSVVLAVAAYNAGPKAVGHWLKQAGDSDLDLWVARIPYAETRQYVWKVVGNLARYGYLDRGEDGVPLLELTLPSGIEVPPDVY